jgi:hypothetical protein
MEKNINDLQKKMSGQIEEQEETEEEQEEMENIQEHEKKEAEEIIEINTPKTNFDNMTEEQIQKKYIEITTKETRKQKLTEEEQEFKTKVEEAITKAEQKAEIDYQERLLQAREEELNKKEEFLKEYQKVKSETPEKIQYASMTEKGLSGETSLLKAITFWLSMKKPKQKGGKILIKVFRDKRVTIEWNNKDLTYVEFHSKDEKGNDLVEITRFNEFIHTFEGTPVPVLFAIQGIPEGYNFFESMKKDITAEMMSQMTLRAYHAGFIKGAELVNPNASKNNILEMLTKFMPLILIIGLVAILYLLNQNYESMKAVYSTVQVMQAQMNTLAPTIDVNALVVR